MGIDPKTIHSSQKNTVEQVQASITTYKGREYADIRAYCQTDDGEWRPTRKGLTLALDLLPELEEAVRKLRKATEPSSQEGDRDHDPDHDAN